MLYLGKYKHQVLCAAVVGACTLVVGRILSRFIYPEMSSKRSTASEEAVRQFCLVTGATAKDAKHYIDKSGGRVDHAIDAYYSDPPRGQRSAHSGPSTTKLGQLFDKYKDHDGDEITVDGTIKLCQDLAVDLEDVVLLAVALELKSPSLGTWTRKGWVDGWKSIGCDSIATMQSSLLRLRDKLGSDPVYFQQVYNYAFEFSRPQGQRSLAFDMAQGFWALLIPHGLRGGALAHKQEDSEDDTMAEDEEGWREEYLEWWFEYLQSKNTRGISKDVWQMFLEFVRTIDAKFANYDMEAAWPSAFDDFVEYAKKRLSS